MLVNFFEREKGGIGYVLRDSTAEVVQGHPGLTQALIETIEGRQRYTAGVLSEETMLPEEIGAVAMKELNFQLRAGLPQESLSTVEVRHSGKGRDERHFLVANVELITGRPYSCYIDRIDRHRFTAWQEHFNLSHGLPNPSDRLRVRPDYSKSRLSKKNQDILMEVWRRVDQHVHAGLITNRLELISYLQTVGYNVRGDTYAGMPLEQPVLLLDDGVVLRMKGSIYYRKDFSPGMLSPAKKDASPEAIAKRLAHLRNVVIDGLEFRAHHTIGRLFGRTEQQKAEKGAARRHLAGLMSTKLTEWECKEPLHSMWSEPKIPETALLFQYLRAGIPLQIQTLPRTGGEPQKGSIDEQHPSSAGEATSTHVIPPLKPAPEAMPTAFTPTWAPPFTKRKKTADDPPLPPNPAAPESLPFRSKQPPMRKPRTHPTKPPEAPDGP
jgi:hypothetical protein